MCIRDSICSNGCTTSAATADPELIKQYHELKSYPMQARSGPLSSDNLAISFKLRMKGDVLSFISTTMISAPRSTSRRRNWRWKRSSPPTI